jgi:phosphoribosyl-AMP cyclohydrolase / phosphoribosyl-ATP pyrophosphohydrolase
MTNIEQQPDFSKGLIPAIIQDVHTQKVLMLGYMNDAAYEKSKQSGKVCFYSRSKDRLWTKGETSGNFLFINEMKLDCDQDTLLVKVRPSGPVCHSGSDTCFKEDNKSFSLNKLESIIAERKSSENVSSYTSTLFNSGINKIAQKVGEEAVELIIEAKDNSKERFLNESADLLFHYLVLLQAKGFALKDVVEVLESRHR